MGRPRKKYKTFHISVPDEDTDIMEWFSVQFNQSASVRQLIRMQIDDYGMCDLFSGGTFKRAEGQSGRATGSSTRVEDEIRKAREILAETEQVAEQDAEQVGTTRTFDEMDEMDEMASGADEMNEMPKALDEALNEMSDETAGRTRKPQHKDGKRQNGEHGDEKTRSAQTGGIVIDRNMLGDVMGAKRRKESKQAARNVSAESRDKDRRDRMQAMLDA